MSFSERCNPVCVFYILESFNQIKCGGSNRRIYRLYMIFLIPSRNRWIAVVKKRGRYEQLVGKNVNDIDKSACFDTIEYFRPKRVAAFSYSVILSLVNFSPIARTCGT